MKKKEDERIRKALGDALILWEQGGQELLERIINGEKNAVENWKNKQAKKDDKND